MLRAVLVACTGMVAIAATLLALDTDAGGNLAAPAAGGPAPAVTSLLVLPGSPDVGEPRITGAVRNVTPAGITAPVQSSPPRAETAAATVSAHPPPTQVPKSRTERLFKPVVVAAGLLAFGERRIRLAGIEAPDPDASCGEGAKAWPCGRMARAALRRFLRGRAVECEFPAGGDDPPDTARCSVAGANLAEWLARQGWAVRVGADYAEVHGQARSSRRGVWSEWRPDAPPQPAFERVAPPSPPARALEIRTQVSGMP